MQGVSTRQPADAHRMREGGIKSLLGGISTRVTKHPGSKPGYRHKLIPTLRLQRDFIYGQLHAEGRLGELASGQKCVPPHVRQRRPLEPTHPMAVADRLRSYGTLTGDARPEPTALSGLTPAQRRRISHKRNHALRAGRPRPVTVKPLSKTPAGTPQPRSGTPSRGFLKMLGRLAPAARDRAFSLWLFRHRP